MLLRKAATASTPVTEITEAGGEWTVKTSTTLKTMELKFKLGEEFDEKTPDGRDVKAKVSFEDGKIVTVQKAKSEKEKSTKSVREMNGADELVYTMTPAQLQELIAGCIAGAGGGAAGGQGQWRRLQWWDQWDRAHWARTSSKGPKSGRTGTVTPRTR